jgi:hypothetical protein
LIIGSLFVDAEVQAHAAEREAHAATKAELHKLRMELVEERRQRDMRQLERDAALSKLDLMKTECLMAIEDRARLREENNKLHTLLQAVQADHRNIESQSSTFCFDTCTDFFLHKVQVEREIAP